MTRSDYHEYMDSTLTQTSILIVEDDERIAQLLTQFLQTEQFAVEWAASGEIAVEKITDNYPDLVILDLMLPKMNGVEVCTTIRPYYHKSILMLTAHEGDIQEVTALNAGVDDFVTKPIRTHVLLARINALLRRHDKKDLSILTVSDLKINRNERTVNRGSDVIALTDSEFELLWELASNAGTIIKREDLFRSIRGIDYDGLDRSIDMRISKLRKKLSNNTNPKDYIRTLRQLGYLFVKD